MNINYELAFSVLGSLVDVSINQDHTEERRNAAHFAAYLYKQYINYLNLDIQRASKYLADAKDNAEVARITLYEVKYI
jgi:hypothetical protein